MSLASCIYIVACYLIGAIPFGLILSRSSGVDIRKSGSCNIGATNVTRLLGRKKGALTLLLDVAKGFFPLYAVDLLSGKQPHQNLTLAFCAAATVLGHMYPVYLGFRGGKGVATGLGIFLYLTPQVLLFCLGVFLLAAGLTGFVSLGSLLAAITAPIALYFLHAPAWKVLLALFIAGMIWIKHVPNIKRLLAGTEKSWKKGKKA